MDLRKNQSPEPVEQKEDLTAQVLDWARDRTGALEGSSPASEAKPSQVTKAKASPKVAVVTLHEGADDRGEASLFEDLQAAARFVETLVENGLDQKRLSVFNCAQVGVHLTYRAVVQLEATAAEEEPAP